MTIESQSAPELSGLSGNPSQVHGLREAAASAFADQGLPSLAHKTAGFAATVMGPAVQQVELMMAATILLAVAGTGWWLLHSASVSFSRTVRSARQRMPIDSSVNSLAERIRAVAHEARIADELNQLQRRADTAKRQFNLTELKAIAEKMTKLLDRLTTAYEVHLSSDSEGRRGFVRNSEDGPDAQPACYLIVCAKDDQGQTIRRRIRDTTTNVLADVDQWAEQVPKAVYDRIIDAKSTDRESSETVFAIKQRGYQDEEVRLTGPDEKPLRRLGQLAKWSD
jgi:hypothetical protein